MNFDNQHSKVYRLIDVFSICIVILCSVHFMANIDTVMNFKLLGILLIFLGLSNLLQGTKKVIAQKNKKGYFYYVLAIILLAWGIENIF